MPKLEGVIFDWAGTMVDYGSMSPVKAFYEAFKKAGLEVTDEEIREPMGMLKREHIKTMLNMPRIKKAFFDLKGRDFTEADIDEIYENFEPALMSVLKDCSTLKPHVLEAVSLLRERGIKIGSTTGYTKAMMDVVVPAAKEQGYEPDAMFAPDMVANSNGSGRPYPYMIFENMKALGLKDVRRIMKLGDTVSDIAEAKNAGIFAVGILEGSSVLGLTKEEYEALSLRDRVTYLLHAKEVFLSAGADAVINNLSELESLIEDFESY